MTTIATWNVNSVKARLPHLLRWLGEKQPDIVFLQELKCVTEAFPAAEIEELGYNLAVHGQKTYNGVAILSKYPLADVTTALPNDPEDLQSRYIEAVASVNKKVLRLASVYVPNGQEVGSDKFSYKLKFLDRMLTHCSAMLVHGEACVIGGDFNVAPAPIDVHDPEKWEGQVLFHPDERSRLRALMNLGLYDAFRTLHPQTQTFSWWDYRMNGWPRNHGLRIDHLLLSAQALDHLKRCEIDTVPRGWEKASDHAPVIVELAI